MKKSAKKQLTAAILAGLTLAVAAPAMAAANPFSDVPAKHWAYDSVSKLAAAGIVDGYGDGTFKGDRTLTRYEMAQMVAKAMAHEDRANAEQKAMIERLAQEFQDELDNLGVRVSNLEKKIGNITWTGQVRSWYDWTDNDNLYDKTSLRTRILLWTTAPLTDDLKFVGRFSSESEWGESNSHWVGSELDMDNAYLQGKNFTFGRQPITLGKGLVYNIGYNNDGATYTFGKDTDKLKLTVAAFKSLAAENYLENDYYTVNSSADVSLSKTPTVYAANLAYQASDDLDITAVYAKTKSQDIYDWDAGIEIDDITLLKTWSVGFGYKGIQNITVTGEYGRNTSEAAKYLNDGDAAQAWVAQIKYKGAEWNKPHSYGIWVGYRDAEPGFYGITGDPLWETAGTINPMNNIKGAEYGFDYTLFKNGIFTFNYLDLESNDQYADRDAKNMTAQLRYMF